MISLSSKRRAILVGHRGECNLSGGRNAGRTGDRERGDRVRRLYLMRHGKAEAGMPPGGGDLERALVARGRRESRRMGAFCQAQAFPPTLILCSPAHRTVETCEAFCEGFGESLPRRVVDGLYMGSPETLLHAVAEAGGREAGVLVVGHNPGLHALALALGRYGPGPDHARLSTRFPTAALAIFETGIDSWAAFRAESARLVAFRTAKELGAEQDPRNRA